MNKKNLYEQQEDIIRKQSEAFITLLTHRGILGEQSIDDEKLRNARQERKKNTYHNTLMLLKHYRTRVNPEFCVNSLRNLQDDI